MNETVQRISSNQLAGSLAGIELSESSRLFANDIIIKLINAMRAEVDGVRWQPQDIEHIHRMRVASRRLRNVLVLFQGCFSQRNVKKWRKNIQLISQTLGAARDLDVQIESLQQITGSLPDKKYKAGIHRILLRLSQQRRKTQKQVVDIVNEMLKGGVLVQIDQAVAPALSSHNRPALVIPGVDLQPAVETGFSIDLYRLAAKAVRSRLDNVLIYEECMSSFDRDVIELHDMRKAAKWLRYTMETFSPLYDDRLKKYIQAAKQIQESLGAIHDCDVWSQYIPALIEEEKKKTLKYYGHLRPLSPILPGINYFQHNWQNERELKLLEFNAFWQKWKEESVFENLCRAVDAPLLSMDVEPAQAVAEQDGKENPGASLHNGLAS